MDQENVDRRVRKTKKQLIAGLTTLMQEKSIKDITVRELSELADINRGTFYLHYRDIFDMVEKIENEMFEVFDQVISKHSPETLNGHPHFLFYDILNFLEDNSDMCMALLGKNGDIAFVDNFRHIVRDKWINYWRNNFKSGALPIVDYYFSFIESGSIGLFQQWLKGGMQESKQEIAQLMEKIVIDGARGFGVLKDTKA